MIQVLQPRAGTGAARWSDDKALTIKRFMALTWPGALVAALYLRLATIGFNPSDEGTLQAHVWRILQGEVPHKDFIFARPLGSALLHIVDFALPLPLILSERLVGILVFVAYSLLLVSLIISKPITRWGFAASCGAVIAVMFDMHTVLLTSWYTTDGILFAAAGMVLLIRDLRSQRRPTAGLLVLGIAPVMKQSFFLAPIIGVLLAARSTVPKRRPREVAAAVATAVTPSVLYVSAISAMGGFRALLHQLTHAEPVYGKSFLTVFSSAHIRGDFLLLLGTAAGLLIVATAWRGSIVELPARLGFTALLLVVPIVSRLMFGGVWAFFLWWTAAMVLMRESLLSRRLDTVGIYVLAVGWMAGLSLGYAGPHLVSGAIFLYAVQRLWRGYRFPAIPWFAWRSLVAATALVTMVVAGNVFLHARDAFPEEEAPRTELTSSLAHVSSRFGPVMTTPVTAGYIQQMVTCIRSHPARWVAVLPDNAAIYPILRLHNPFPMDWMFPNEVSGYASRMLGSAVGIDRGGHYLILFQTFSTLDLRRMHSLTAASVSSPPFFYGRDLGKKILDRLHGERIACGTFVGAYAP